MPAAEWMMKSGSEMREVEYNLGEESILICFDFNFSLPCVGVIDLIIMKTKAEFPARSPGGNLVFIKINPCSNLQEPVPCLLRKIFGMDLTMNAMYLSAYLRCQLEGCEECLLVNVSALIPGCLTKTQRLPV